MQLVHLPLSTLHLAKTNMRYAEKDDDVSDLVPTIRKRGILQPLLVRPNNVGHAIEAGRRRYLAAKIVAADGDEHAGIGSGQHALVLLPVIGAVIMVIALLIMIMVIMLAARKACWQSCSSIFIND